MFFWREKVASWVNLITTAPEEKEYKLYKPVFHTLYRQLYDRGIFQAQRSIVDKAQDKGYIGNKQDKKIAAAWEVVDLIAQGALIAVVIRIIDSFNKTMKRKRKSNEELKRFVFFFSGFAAEHFVRTE